MKTTILSEDIYLYASIAKNTRIAYEKGWSYWVKYCASRGVQDLPANPDDVVQFLIDQATQPRPNGKILSLGTVVLWRSAINWKHIESGYTSPTNNPKVINVMRGLARVKGRQCRQVKALREYHIKQMLDKCEDAPIGYRNAAIIAVGFAGALRRSEICGLRVEDIKIVKPESKGQKTKMFLYIAKSKTDQEGMGHRVAVPEGRVLQPIKRLQRWLDISGIRKGPVFQTMRRGGTLRGFSMHHSDIPRIIKHYAELIGLNPKEIAGHSLRAGFVTSAVVHQARLDKIMEVTRHRNPSTVMKYIRDANTFKDHAGEKFL